MPSQLESEFYMLKYFRRGNDGSVGVACTPSGRLCVMKFPVDEKKARMLGEEMRSWNSLWQTDCFICRLKDYRLALVMPFCLHVRVFAHGKRFFCGLNDWNGANRETSEIFDDEVCEFNRIDKSDLQKYQDDPLKAAEKALTRMINQNVEHQSLKWSRIALMPRFDSTAVDATVKLCPIMIDMTHNRPISNYRAMNVQQMLARLITRD
jgi:hypothetical protein